MKHLQAFPSDNLETALRNVFDFDVHKTETMDALAEILDAHGYVLLRVTSLIVLQVILSPAVSDMFNQTIAYNGHNDHHTES